MTYYLAIDIGASSGRHILSHIENERLVLEEIYRFDNNLTQSKNGLVWDIDSLFSEVLNGIKKCKEIGKIPKSIAIDTWGVDYVLLDENKKEIKPYFCYRDSRTNAVVDEVESLVSSTELYAKTGIQKQNFNTIYQLYADKKSGRLLNAKYFLMMPEYLSFKLTGVCKNEYTNATTTGLVNANAKTWDSEIISVLGLPKELFAALNTPSSIVGDLSANIQKAVGFNSTVLFAPSHDTASAVCACPMQDDDLYISSGTWSPDELMTDIDKVISLVPGKMKLNLPLAMQFLTRVNLPTETILSQSILQSGLNLQRKEIWVSTLTPHSFHTLW